MAVEVKKWPNLGSQRIHPRSVSICMSFYHILLTKRGKRKKFMNTILCVAKKILQLTTIKCPVH